MPFSSVTFLFFFLPVFFLLTYALPWQNAILLGASLIFYGWGDPARLPLLLLFIVLNWGFGLLARHRAALAAGVFANLSLLVWFKYAGFIAAQIGVVDTVTGRALPLGISFFAFQGISYLVDIGRGVVAPQRSLFRYATYKTMFPPLIAGPIVRYCTIAGSLERRRPSRDEVSEGIVLFATGLAQKVLLANTLATPVDRIFAIPTAQLSAGTAWLGAAGYALQIYFDFNGYTNMAIGLGRMMGFHLPPNFDLPYASRSLTEFWRRWHISLSSWFRDYLYIPIGGSRLGAARTAANLLLVFLLCGLWHGAAWSFAVWGLYHGLFLALERIGLGRIMAQRPIWLRHLYLLVVVVVGWVPFRAADLDTAWHYGLAMIEPGRSLLAGPDGASLTPATFLTPMVTTALLIGAACSVWRPSPRLLGRPSMLPLQRGVCLVLVVLSAARLAAGTYNPFIYFRF